MHAWAVVANGEPLEEIMLPTPEPQGSQVLLEVMHCGVCHSDVHLWEGYYALGGDKKMLLRDRGVTLPIVLGHEIVGRVAAVGPHASGVRIGDVVIVYPWVGCGTCARCRGAADHMCLTPRSIGVFQPGGHASHVLVPEPRHLVPIGSLPAPLAATYACSGLTAFSAVKKTLPAAPDDPIVVIGIGGLGLSAVSILRALGHERIIAVDVSAGNREAALRAGATDALDGATVPLAPALVETAGPGGIGAVIDFVNNTTTSRAGFDALRRGGILVAVGFFGGELAIGLPLLPLRALTVQGSYVGSPADLRSLVELAEGGKLPAIPVASVAQHAATGVLAQLRDGKITGRVVLDAAARYPAATAGSAPAADFATSTP